MPNRGADGATRVKAIAGRCAGMALSLLPFAAPSFALVSPQELIALHAERVDSRLAAPQDEQKRFAEALEGALQGEDVLPLASQFIMWVDRSAQMQAILLFWRPSAGEAILVGASPASTGRPSGFEHFETPLGVFDHSTANLDFRAEGTENELGICGYGVRGMRVFDFGWVQGQRAWRKKGEARCVCRCTPPTHAASSRASAHASRRLHLHSGDARRVPRLLRHSRCRLRP